jgi:hypothetical protein
LSAFGDQASGLQFVQDAPDPLGISATSVQQIWRSFGLQPWRAETFKVSPDPLLVPKIRDVVGLYLNPPRNAVVFSVDELCEASHNSSDVKSSVM